MTNGTFLPSVHTVDVISRNQMHVNNSYSIKANTLPSTQNREKLNDNNSSESVSSGTSAGVNTISEASDDSSLNSVDLEPTIAQVDCGATLVDSDTGLESMSSAEAITKTCLICKEGLQTPADKSSKNEATVAVENLRQEITRLKCDKLDLLRHNVVNIKRNSFSKFIDISNVCASYF